MASESVHLAVANRNQSTINYLCRECAQNSPWIVTVAFYKALHIVEAVFSNDASILHTTDHSTRFAKLRTVKKYQNIFRHYSPLSRASNIARYLEDGGNNVSVFSEYLTPDQVTEEFLFHHLKQIENSARKKLQYPNSLRNADEAKEYLDNRANS